MCRVDLDLDLLLRCCIEYLSHCLLQRAQRVHCRGAGVSLCVGVFVLVHRGSPVP